jgi:hypothetical protein
LGESLAAAAGGAAFCTAWGGELTVRLTIERMRTLVLAAGVLLIGLLVVFLVIGKGKNFFNRRDLPQRLGLDIQQEGNGYTYSHVLGRTRSTRFTRRRWCS